MSQIIPLSLRIEEFLYLLGEWKRTHVALVEARIDEEAAEKRKILAEEGPAAVAFPRKRRLP